MKIKSMTATFGKLEKARLEPGPGLTLVHAPNEGGKSTWAAFWRAMLYGIDTRERDKKGYLADKNRYQPWSGAPMEGEITLEYEKKDITIRRGPKGNIPFGAFSAVYTKTQQPVPGLTASNCGELLTGAGAEVFARSAFLGAGNLTVTTAPELERRIAALVSSGEEDVSFSQAMERLKEWKNRRQVNKSVGDIPKLEGELAQLGQSLEQMGAVTAQITQLEGERAELIRERERLFQQAELHRQLARRQVAQRYAKAEEEYRSAQEQYERLERELERFGALPDRERLKEAQGDLQYLKVLDEEIKQGSSALEAAEESAAQAEEAAKDEHFTGLNGEEAEEQVNRQIRGAEQSRAKAAAWKRGGWLALLLAAGLLLALQFYFKQNAGWSPAGWWFSPGLPLLAVVLFLLGGFCLLRGRKIKRDSGSILVQYQVQSPEELTAKVQDYQKRCQAAEKAVHEMEIIRNAVVERREKRDGAKMQLLDFVHSFAPEVKDLFGCSAALSRALNLEHDLTIARERAEERRRRLEDLSAQGAGGEATTGDLPAPEQGPEEIERALNHTEEQLEGVSARLNQAQGSLRTMGDPAAQSARREELEEKLAQRRLEREALTVAMEALTQASAQLQERFSPELNRLAGAYMARLTGDKYQAVSLTRELEGFVRDQEGVLPRSVLYLSRGTADQLYLAVRLAVCRLCLPEKPPILLDDALAAFDDERLTLALELLWELSSEQQMLLFTCQKREGEILGSMPGVTKIEL